MESHRSTGTPCEHMMFLLQRKQTFVSRFLSSLNIFCSGSDVV
jgi:hypothetical protein